MGTHTVQVLYNITSHLKFVVFWPSTLTYILDFVAFLTLQAAAKRPHMAPFERRAFVIDHVTGRRVVDSSWGAIKIGLYDRHLDRWLRYFRTDQFHFVNGEQLVRDPAGEVGRVQDFLGLRRVIGPDHFYFNATKGFPCLRTRRPRCLGKDKGRRHPVVDPEALELLRQFYRPHNERFFAMTGVNFRWN